MKLLRQMLTNPRQTGAIANTSPKLSRLIADMANLDQKNCVVELGAGTGVFTREIVKRISSQCTFFSLEINPILAKETQNNCPSANIFCDSAENIQTYLSSYEKTSCDCIISGLPWGVFEFSLQKQLLHTIYQSLDNGGEFLTIALLPGLLFPPGKRFRSLLDQIFSSVTKSHIVWQNLPPGFIYHCKKEKGVLNG